MAAGRQPRWPDGTPVAPSGRGPGGGRWKDDGKPNKPRKSWAEVASEVIGHARGAASRAMGRPQGPRDSSHDHDGNLELDYPARMKQRGATDADLTVPARKAAPRKAAPAKKAAPRKAAVPRAAVPTKPTAVAPDSRRLSGESQADYDERMRREYPYAAMPGTTEYEQARAHLNGQPQGSNRLPGESQSDFDARMEREYPYASMPGTTKYEAARRALNDQGTPGRYDSTLPGTPAYEDARRRARLVADARAVAENGEPIDDTRVAMPGTPAYEEAKRRSRMVAARAASDKSPDWAERIGADMPSSSGRGRAAMSDEDLTDVLSAGPGVGQRGANARAVDYLDGVHSDRLRALRDKLATERSRGRGRIGDRSVIESLDHVIDQRGEVSEGSVARERLQIIEGQIRAGKGKRTPIKKRVLDHLSEQQLTFAELEDIMHQIERRQNGRSAQASGAYDHRIYEAVQEALRLQGSPKYRAR